MSTIIVAVILIAIIAAIVFLLMAIDEHEKRKHMNKLLKHFSELGARYNLLVSSQTILRDSILGVDGIKRKILFLTRNDEGEYDHLLFDVDEIKSCLVSKTYGSIRDNRLRTLNLDQYLEEIILRFEFTTSRPPVNVLFYRHLQDQAREARQLAQKAKDLEMMLYKMRQKPLKKQRRAVSISN